MTTSPLGVRIAANLHGASHHPVDGRGGSVKAVFRRRHLLQWMSGRQAGTGTGADAGGGGAGGSAGQTRSQGSQGLLSPFLHPQLLAQGDHTLDSWATLRGILPSIPP